MRQEDFVFAIPWGESVRMLSHAECRRIAMGQSPVIVQCAPCADFWSIAQAMGELDDDGSVVRIACRTCFGKRTADRWVYLPWYITQKLALHDHGVALDELEAEADAAAVEAARIAVEEAAERERTAIPRAAAGFARAMRSEEKKRRNGNGRKPRRRPEDEHDDWSRRENGREREDEFEFVARHVR